MNVSIGSGKNRLNQALKDLRDRWDETKETWNDRVRDDFERQHMVPLEAAVNRAGAGMQELSEVLGKMMRDCSDREEY